ncbi:MAG: Tricorn protease like protein [Candidatus Aminicenantes bacterium]|nr:Tricorn protease like protein [Candidatus Aminicenantes bacterium]
MKKKTCLVLLALGFLAGGLRAQISAKLMRYLDVSDKQISFVYGGDIWLVDKNGGTAVQLTRSPGEESWPRFSPDGSRIAYTAAYNGNPDVYVIPVQGGVPMRVTYPSFADRLVDWHPDGKRLLFASNRAVGVRGLNHFYLVPATGGFPERLKVPYGELASFSEDGKQLAYVTRITESYPFKRYRGGYSSDVIIYDLTNDRAKNITGNKAIDGKPAWVGSSIYFLSDRDENMRLNIWRYDTGTGKTEQITRMTDFDIAYMSAGPADIVFECGGRLYLMDLKTHKHKPVDVRVVSDLSVEIPRRVDVSRQASRLALSPQSKRVALEARGEIFDIPVKEGAAINLTNSSSSFDRHPAWSPDGRYLAYWSDRSGEYQIYLRSLDGKGGEKALTRRTKGYGYTLNWSPDGKNLAFVDETSTIWMVKVETGEAVKAGHYRAALSHPAIDGYQMAWSPDSRWLAFTENLENAHDAIFIYDLKTNAKRQATSGFYQDFGPVFSRCGRYLFFFTNRNMEPIYSDMDDGTWVYPNASQIACLSLTSKAPSLLLAKNDAFTAKPAEDKPKPPEEKKPEEKKPEAAAAKTPEVEIEFDGLESRLTLLPVRAGNFGGLFAFKDKIIFHRIPNTGTGQRTGQLVLLDLQTLKEDPVMEEVDGAGISADGESLLVRSGPRYGVISPAPGQKIKDPIPLNNLFMNLTPKEEWRQIFADTWRRYRDFFYDPAMHGVDWGKMRERYGALVEDARTRWDVTNICSNMQAELSAGHTYTGGGDVEQVSPVLTGFLGIDWKLENGTYRIQRVVRPAAWDTAVRSPFDAPGIAVKEGDAILAVNQVELRPDLDPFAAFEGLSGRTVSLLVATGGNAAEAKTVVVKSLTGAEESALRNLEWIEANRRRVETLSGGKLGYIYMSNTSMQGQSELVRMFYGQLDKEGFIIDERFNGGGQLADRFLELLRRPIVYNIHWRQGRNTTQPIKANNGPLGMLINGWAGSGGDGLPWAFQELKAGPIVGEHTLGILVGPATGHVLIDGGSITVPDGRLYDNDGHWFWEGEGVAPDFEVWDDPNALVRGNDLQIEKAVEEVMKLTKTNPRRVTPAPAPENRTAAGLKKK